MDKNFEDQFKAMTEGLQVSPETSGIEAEFKHQERVKLVSDSVRTMAIIMGLGDITNIQEAIVVILNDPTSQTLTPAGKNALLAAIATYNIEVERICEIEADAAEQKYLGPDAPN